MKTCNSCGNNEKKIANIPFIVYESAITRADKKIKTLICVVATLVIALIGTNILWIVGK